MYTIVYSFCRRENTMFVLDGHYPFESAVIKLKDETVIPTLGFYGTCDCCGERWESWRVDTGREVTNLTHILPNKKLVYHSEVGRFVMTKDGE